MKKYIAKVRERQGRNEPAGIVSICSSNSDVLDAVFFYADQIKGQILIEATCNQVNQFGGYTGNTPAEFRSQVLQRADEFGVENEKLMLGGDHLGVVPFQTEPASKAMKKGKKLVYDFAHAGFSKIHLDASPSLTGDSLPLQREMIARRTAVLCLEAERGFKESNFSEKEPPVYVIGSEVPSPGGDEQTEAGEGPRVTSVAEFKESLLAMKTAFQERDLEDAWERVMAYVVQIGVEFEKFDIHDYNPKKFKNLSKLISSREKLIFEGHSTDYQTFKSLKQMVNDGIAVLKVGPGLTFALREALFALDAIEQELSWQLKGEKTADFSEVLLREMKMNPGNWHDYYSGSDNEVQLACKYSYYDRSRYYLARPDVEKARNKLMNNFNKLDVPSPMLRQYLPKQYKYLRRKNYEFNSKNLIRSAIFLELKRYLKAAGQLKD